MLQNILFCELQQLHIIESLSCHCSQNLFWHGISVSSSKLYIQQPYPALLALYNGLHTGALTFRCFVHSYTTESDTFVNTIPTFI